MDTKSLIENSESGRLFYYDVSLPLAYPVQKEVDKNYLNIKVPCSSVFDFLHYIESILKFRIDSVVGVRQYTCTKIEGNTRFTFKEVREYSPSEVTEYVLRFKRYKRKGYQFAS